MPDDIDPRLLQWMADRNRFAEQNADGVDLSLIESNLKLTPLERIRQAYRLQLQIERLRGIGRAQSRNSV